MEDVVLARTKRPTRLALSLLVPVMSILAGCTPSPLVELYYAGPERFAVLVGTKEAACTAAAGERCTFRFAPEIRISVDGGATRSYRFPAGLRYEASPEFVVTRFPLTHIFKMQLDGAGRIWALSADASGVVKRPPARQLAGFPMAPAANQ